MAKAKAPDQLMQQIVAGRTFEEQVEDIKKHGNHGVSSILRDRVLVGAGIPKAKEKADNLLVFGCYLPFLMPDMLRDYMGILDRLGMSHTYLTKEYCCGLPMIENADGSINENAMNAGNEFMTMNRDMAIKMGASRIAYGCIWCAHLAKKFFPDDTIQHSYFLDLIVDGLESTDLNIDPVVMGYYEGCHRRNRNYAPGAELDWDRYRKLLNNIKGLEIVEMPDHICCTLTPKLIVEAAEKKGVETIVCSCVSCYRRIGIVSEGKIKTKQFTEVILEALDRK